MKLWLSNTFVSDIALWGINRSRYKLVFDCVHHMNANYIFKNLHKHIKEFSGELYSCHKNDEKCFWNIPFPLLTFLLKALLVPLINSLVNRF